MRVDLTDPSCEPTDEDLRALSRAAFADVKARHQAALARLFAGIDAERQRRRGEPPTRGT